MEDDLLKAENERLAMKLDYGLEYYKGKLDLWSDNFEFHGQYDTHEEVNEILKAAYDKKFK